MKRNRNRNRRKSLSYGKLEPKRLLAGNVRANVQGEHIFIRGDQFDNQIRIDTNDNGFITIDGLNGTTINNRPSVVVENSVLVSGEDRVGSQFAGGLRVHLGPGDDAIDVDGIRLNDRSIIYGGLGNDEINVSNTEVIDTAVVQTFTGDDNVVISNTLVTDTLFAFTLDGQDSLIVEDSITRGSAVLTTGNGNDFLRLDSNQHVGATQIALTQDGDDAVEIENVNVGIGTLEVYTGQGDDTAAGNLTQGDIAGTLIIAGQGDVDRTELTIGNENRNNVSLRGFEFDGELEFENADQVDFGRATFSRANDSFFIADNVEFNRGTRIGSIDFLGSYENSTPPVAGDQLVIEIFESGTIESDVFGEYTGPIRPPVATFNIGDNANRVDTGAEWAIFEEPRTVFSYSADIDFFFLADREYWISIYSNTVAEPNGSFNDFYTVAEEITASQADEGALVFSPGFGDWIPNISGKTHFTLRS